MHTKLHAHDIERRAEAFGRDGGGEGEGETIEGVEEGVEAAGEGGEAGSGLVD